MEDGADQPPGREVGGLPYLDVAVIDHALGVTGREQVPGAPFFRHARVVDEDVAWGGHRLIGYRGGAGGRDGAVWGQQSRGQQRDDGHGT